MELNGSAYIHVPTHDFSANTSSLGNEAAFDEAGEQDMNYERKHKRIISNRDSARRSRMRKKKQIEELQYQVNQLHSTNRQLSEKLIQLLEGNQQILQVNAQLKESLFPSNHSCRSHHTSGDCGRCHR